ncbi:MAG: 50S ribosomal protein L17 [Thermoanaerobaculia bacterium]|nr:50S ribosomal protein L17 [Thermoanaerobaculia bacterium]
MRHNVAGRKLGRTTSHRLALFRNQLASLMAAERIVTTLPKAKELRPIAEKLITHGKAGTVHARRMVGRWIPDRDLIKKLFDEIAPRHAERPGGYLRIVKLGNRLGDGAEMAVLEFVDYDPAKKRGVAGKGEAAAKPAEGAPAAEKPKKEKSERKAAEAKPERAEAKKAAKPTARPAAPAKKKPSMPKKIGGS